MSSKQPKPNSKKPPLNGQFRLKRKRPRPTATSSKTAKAPEVQSSPDTIINETSQKKKNPNKAESKEKPSSASLPVGSCVGVSERFKKICRIGEGTYGIVYKAEDRQNPGDFVALKRCIPHHEGTDGYPMTALREILSLRLLQQHPNVVTLRTDIGMVAVSKSDNYLVFEYCEHELAQLLDFHYTKQRNPRNTKGGIFGGSNNNPKSPFTEANVKTLMTHLLSALECMHDHRLIHRDIKVSNLLYSASGHLKLADFGLSRSLPSQEPLQDGGYHLTPNVVSLWYRPPELLLGSKTYSQAIDMWGAGCVFAELLLGYPLWSGKSESEQMEAIFSTVGPPSVESWPNLLTMPLIQDGSVKLEKYAKVRTSSMPLLDSFSYLATSGLMLLANLLHYDANGKRLTASQALQSSYFASEPLPTPPAEMPKFKSLHTAKK
ncbi:Mitogen-activated protein kinase HOG1 (Fragment) [Seminavis robusta]|uniref:Cyclin-dependent kinase 2 homolog n=1 Tax=Seminavis robusta TaxID=568900 RepID=A0A9N8ECL9_9STRA